MPLQFLPAFSGSCCVKSWQNNPILAFLVQCCVHSEGKSLCRTLQGLRDLFYLWSNLSLTRALPSSSGRSQMSPRTWVSAVSQELISNILSTSKNVYFCSRMSQYRQLMCREGEKKERKKRVSPNGWMDNGLSAWVIMTLNLPWSQNLFQQQHKDWLLGKLNNTHPKLQLCQHHTSPVLGSNLTISTPADPTNPPNLPFPPLLCSLVKFSPLKSQM